MAKCGECGFLCHRDLSSGELVELHYATRDAGQVLFIQHGAGIARLPIVCFARERTFPDLEQSPAIMDTITAEITCPQFTPWRQGFTPKEHAEMVYSERLERMTRESNDRREQIQREWLREQNDRNRIATLFSAGLQSIATLAAVVIAYYLARK